MIPSSYFAAPNERSQTLLHVHTAGLKLTKFRNLALITLVIRNQKSDDAQIYALNNQRATRVIPLGSLHRRSF